MKATLQTLTILVLFLIAIVLLGIHPSPFITVISKVGSVGIGFLIGKLLVTWNMIDINERA